MQQLHCEVCGEVSPSHDIINFSARDQASRQMCSLCFNAEVAKRSGLESFDNVRLDPIGITDCAGESHQFHFQTRLLGHIVTLDAFELKDGQRTGYAFQIIGAPDEDHFVLLGRMIGKIRKALSVKHITDHGDGHGLQIADQTVRGRIEWDDSNGDHMPLVVVDGVGVSWENFGRLLSTFEGWQFKLEIFDRSDET